MRSAGLSISSAILFFACAVFAHMQTLGAKDTWVAANLSTEEAKQIAAAAEQSAFDTPESWENELLVRRVDLGSGPGIIARGTNLLCGGTGNCQIFVLRKVNSKWVSLFGDNQAPVAESFQLGPGVTNGIKDLTISTNLSAESSTRVVYGFDGKGYRQIKSNSAASEAVPPPVRTAPLFEFHNNFWVNLHQTLFHEALLQAGKPDRRLQSKTPLSLPEMSAQEKADWNSAVAFYAETFGSRRELFDDEMVRINGQLAAQADDGAALSNAGLPSKLAAILQSAAPVYRKYWWPVHKKSNEDWIASQRARVSALGPQIAAAMEKDLHEAWPAAPIRVDVCYFVPEIGHAYTTDDPAHTTFSSSAPTLAGLNGFETLFHEASHSFARTMAEALAVECRTEKKNCGELWHAVLFYTAGVETRRALPPADQANFTPYAYKYGLYMRGDFPKYRAVLEADWQKHLDGKLDFANAIHDMVADLQQ